MAPWRPHRSLVLETRVFLTALAADPEDIQKAKTLGVGYLDSDTVIAAISAAQWPDGQLVRGIHCGALHRLHAATRKLAIDARESPKATAPGSAAQAATTDNDSCKFASATDQTGDGCSRACPRARFFSFAKYTSNSPGAIPRR